MKSLNSSLLKNRVNSLLKLLQEKDVQGCIVEEPVDLFYLTGLSLSHGALVATHGKITLFVDGRYIQAALEDSPVPCALYEDRNLLAFLEKKPVDALVFDALTTSFEEFERLKKLFPETRLEPFPGLLRDLRLIKDAYEQSALRKSARLLAKGFEYLKKRLRVGITELELALEFEIFCRRNGAEKLAFDPIIAFGANSAMPHYHPGKSRLKRGDIVLIDIGVVVDHYYSDMTRTLFFGKPDPFLKKWQAIVKEAHSAALKICKPGTKLGALDAAARAVMAKEGVENYFLHSLGHGVGLEIHEYPRIKATGVDKDLILKEGMTITIEPGLYLPGKGGIRYEDTVILTKKGYENLYKC